MQINSTVRSKKIITKDSNNIEYMTMNPLLQIYIHFLIQVIDMIIYQKQIIPF